MTGVRLPHLLILGWLGVICCQGAADVAVAPENSIDKPTEGAVTPDIHGGVQMGVPNPDCDDGETNIQIDYNLYEIRETCRCTAGKKGKRDFKKVQQMRKYKGIQGGDHSTSEPVLSTDIQCQEDTQTPIHTCLDESIDYGYSLYKSETDDTIYNSSIPTSGRHRPLWPKFGEYQYLPQQRWIHSLEHGAIVFLYHPCAEEAQVNQLRTIATSCLNKHIITPYTKLPIDLPFAILSWGCKLQLHAINEDMIKEFIIAKALLAPETHVAEEGQYERGLIRGVGLDAYEVDGEDVCPETPKGTPIAAEALRKAQKSNCRDLMALAGSNTRQRYKNRRKGKGNGGKGKGKGRGRGGKFNKDLGERMREREDSMQALLTNRKKQKRNKKNRKHRNQ